MSAHQIRFPGESQKYREARDRLLDAEIELRRLRATDKGALLVASCWQLLAV